MTIERMVGCERWPEIGPQRFGEAPAFDRWYARLSAGGRAHGIDLVAEFGADLGFSRGDLDVSLSTHAILFSEAASYGVSVGYIAKIIARDARPGALYAVLFARRAIAQACADGAVASITEDRRGYQKHGYFTGDHVLNSSYVIGAIGARHEPAVSDADCNVTKVQSNRKITLGVQVRHAVERVGNTLIAAHADAPPEAVASQALVHVARLLLLAIADPMTVAGILATSPREYDAALIALRTDLEGSATVDRDLHARVLGMCHALRERGRAFQIDITENANHAWIALVKGALFDLRTTPGIVATPIPDEVVSAVYREVVSAIGKRTCTPGDSMSLIGELIVHFTEARGTVADMDLVEVGTADDWSIGRTRLALADQIGEYSRAELGCENGGVPRIHQAGKFVLASGRRNDKDGAFFTPECLVSTLVGYTLKERLKSVPDADGILDLTLCDPCAGSGTFPVEAVFQLADAYLKRKQVEKEKTIPLGSYAREHAKIAAHIARHNLYAVELNPQALELLYVSLALAIPIEEAAP